MWRRALEGCASSRRLSDSPPRWNQETICNFYRDVLCSAPLYRASLMSIIGSGATLQAAGDELCQEEPSA
jgi:hypothetical protein